MQKLLDQMNMQLHHAAIDITGYSGLAILNAIIDGQRDPEALARLCDNRCPKSEGLNRESRKGPF